MTDDQQVANTEPAANGEAGQGTAPEPGDTGTATPATPAAGQQAAATPPADGSGATPTDDDGGHQENDGIQNPAAYYKAQAEKNQRLLDKAEKAREEMERLLKDRQDEDAQAIRQQNAQLLEELQAERARVRQAELNALKIQIGAKHGLDAGLAERLVGDTADAIAEDAERLAKLVPSPGRRANVGNPSGSSTGGSQGPGKMPGQSGINPWTGEPE